MIDINSEQLMTLGRAVSWLADRFGCRFSRNTAYRWAKVGVHGNVLETVRVGGMLFTSTEAIDRFVHNGGLFGAARPYAASGRAAMLAARRAEELFGGKEDRR